MLQFTPANSIVMPRTLPVCPKRGQKVPFDANNAAIKAASPSSGSKYEAQTSAIPLEGGEDITMYE